jgi:protein-disulfide isomerase
VRFNVARARSVLVLSMAILAVVGCTPASPSPDPVVATPANKVTVSTATLGDGPKPAATVLPGDQNVYDGVSVGLTAEGYPYRGDPDAPVTIYEYSDFLCPFCARHVQQTEPDLLESYVKTGKARFVFRDYPIASLHPTAPIGHQAAQCVAEQGAALFWAMHDRLLAEQAQWQSLPDPKEYLAEAAAATGADKAAYEACMSSGRTVASVDQGVADAQKLGYNGTPTFRFTRTGSEDAYTLEGAQPLNSFGAWLDAMAAGGDPPQEPTPAPPELPFWAKPEGLAPDPDRPGFTMAGDPYKGDPGAVMTVVEFSDFQCPSCRRHALEIQPTIDDRFVETGDVRWVFKHLPLRMHPQAPAAAAAAECSAEAGRFWEMYDLLFEEIDAWSVPVPEPILTDLAAGAGLDATLFLECLQGRKAWEAVLSDVFDAQGAASSTPTFVILYGGRGTVMEGTQVAGKFTEILQRLLEDARGSDGDPQVP